MRSNGDFYPRMLILDGHMDWISHDQVPGMANNQEEKEHPREHEQWDCVFTAVATLNGKQTAVALYSGATAVGLLLRYVLQNDLHSLLGSLHGTTH